MKIKLKVNDIVTNMNGIFEECSSLSDIPKWNINSMTNMSYMFYGCSSISSLPDISKWNTNNVNDMSYMFCGCSSLSSLPDISKWNTNNVNDMWEMFRECSNTIFPKFIKTKFNEALL